MKPEISIPSVNQEVLSSPVDSIDRSLGVDSAERARNGSEVASRASEIDFSSVFPAPAIQQPSTVITDSNTNIGTNDNPVVAAHSDIIEKEWVDRAKKIVAENRDDPYQQEKSISELQIDYIKKRYGGDVSAA
jgi:hypothetical protein